MKLKLTKEESNALLPKIQAVLDTGTPFEDEQLHMPVEAIVNGILSIPGVTRKKFEDARYGIDGFDTNGWQWDWWQHFTHNGKEYTLSGSGYYGGHSFQLSD
jgi:hypothetical protein